MPEDKVSAKSFVLSIEKYDDINSFINMRKASNLYQASIQNKTVDPW